MHPKGPGSFDVVPIIFFVAYGNKCTQYFHEYMCDPGGTSLTGNTCWQCWCPLSFFWMLWSVNQPLSRLLCWQVPNSDSHTPAAVILDGFFTGLSDIDRNEKIFEEALRYQHDAGPLDVLLASLSSFQSQPQLSAWIVALFEGMDVDENERLSYAELRDGFDQLGFQPPIRYPLGKENCLVPKFAIWRVTSAQVFMGGFRWFHLLWDTLRWQWRQVFWIVRLKIVLVKCSHDEHTTEVDVVNFEKAIRQQLKLWVSSQFVCWLLRWLVRFRYQSKVLAGQVCTKIDLP